MQQLVAARLLGAPVLTVDGAPAPPELLWRKHVALCLVLWFAPERRRSRDQLVGLLWADKDERAARHSLNEALRVIRRSVGDDVLDTSSDSVAWVIAPALDTDRFASCESSDPEAASAIVAGPFCDGFTVPGAEEFEQWLEPERRRWQRRMIAVLARAARLSEDRGDIDAALHHAERGIGLDPHSDMAARAVIRAHWLRGDRVASLAAAEAFRIRLDAEVGVEPEDATQRLVAQVTRERRPTARAGASVPTRNRPLYGREAALDQLLKAWRGSVETPRSALLILSGAAGCGRTRLLDELVSRAVLDGAATATLRAVPGDADDPDGACLGLAISGLAGARGIAAASPGAITALASRLPLWSERFPGAAAPSGMSISESFAEVVLAATEEQPVMLAIDDAQRLHPAALRALPVLLRTLGARPVTLVLSVESNSGTEATDELIRIAGRDLPGAVQRVEPLDGNDLERLVGWNLGAWTADARARLARRLLAESAGLPMIAAELIDAVAGGLSMDSPAWPAPDRTLDATMPGPLPEPLVAAIRLAFRHVSAESQALLTAASLMPEPVSADRLGRVVGATSATDRDALLDALEWAGWLVADGRGYSFPARAKRRVIAEEMMTPGQRTRLAKRIAATP